LLVLNCDKAQSIICLLASKHVHNCTVNNLHTFQEHTFERSNLVLYMTL
jgi:hypothetical protein